MASTPVTIDRYCVLEVIGVGAMGRVYKAVDPLMSRTVALKVIQFGSDAAKHQMLVDRFVRETELYARLQHPHIVRLLDSRLDNERSYLAMEYVDGLTLTRWMTEYTPSLAEICSVVDQLANAIDYANCLGIVHRDIKPGNILVKGRSAEMWHAMLMDFGIASVVDEATLALTGERRLGTLLYMSPEQLTDGANVDARTDVWGLAATLYQLLGGVVPFDCDECPDRDHRRMLAIMYEPPGIPSDLAERGYDRKAWENVFGRALAKRPAVRYQSATAFAAALRSHLLEGASVTESTHVSAPATLVSKTIVPDHSVTLADQLPEAAPISAPEEPALAVTKGWQGLVGVLLLVGTIVGLGWRVRERRFDAAPPDGAAVVRISIASTPAGAGITIDGRDTGMITPAVVPVSAGTSHRVVLRMPCYEDTTIDLRASTAAPIDAVLREAAKRTLIDSIPKGAEVFVGGRRLGITPFEVEVPCTATQAVEIGLAGYRSESLVLRGDGLAAQSRVVLQRQAGSTLDIASEHPYRLDVTTMAGAPVYAGMIPVVVPVAPGRYTIQYRSECGYSNRWDIVVGSGQALPVSLPAPGTLEGVSASGARLLLDGQAVQEIRERCVGAGRHTITATWPDGRQIERVVLVQPGGRVPAFTLQ